MEIEENLENIGAELNAKYFSTKIKKKYLKYVDVIEENHETKCIIISCKICVLAKKKDSKVSQAYINGGTSNIRRHLRTHQGVLEELDSTNEDDSWEMTFLDALTSFAVQNAISFRALNSSSFKKLVNVLNVNAKVPDRQNISHHVSNQYEKVSRDIKSDLKEALLISGTLDIWSKNSKSFIGTTAHFIDQNTLQRRNFSMSCKRIVGRHDYLNIAHSFHEILQEFDVVEKMKYCTSDQAANIKKTFRYFLN